jgi:hypothetical protein
MPNRQVVQDALGGERRRCISSQIEPATSLPVFPKIFSSVTRQVNRFVP